MSVEWGEQKIRIDISIPNANWLSHDIRGNVLEKRLVAKIFETLSGFLSSNPVIKIDIGPQNIDPDLVRILERCCALRGLSPKLIHRTLHEFDWFVHAMIFGNNTLYYGHNAQKVFDRWNSVYSKPDATLIDYAYAFEEYCVEEYPDQQMAIQTSEKEIERNI